MTFLHGDDRFYNNIFVQQPKRPGMVKIYDYLQGEGKNGWDDGNLDVGTWMFDNGYQLYEEWVKEFDGYCGMGSPDSEAWRSNDETQHTEFCGLPTPANALFFSSLGFIGVRTGLDFGGWTLLLFVVAMSWLLVSPVRMFALKFRGFGWRGNEIRYLFLLLCVAVIASLRLYSIPVIILLYILISAIRWGMQANRRAAGQEPQTDAPERSGGEQ